MNKLYIGVHYEYPFGGMGRRPEWLPKGPDDWRRDLREIRDTGFNIIRIRIGFDCELDDVCQLLDMALENHLKVIFGFATFYVNDEFVEKYPDSRFIHVDGSVHPQGVDDWRWQRACINHTSYLEIRDKLVEDCVRKFKDHEAVYIWDIHNEPSIPMCYCPYTVKEFRKWLREAYGDISSLNKDWGTCFEGFTSLEPPRLPDEPKRRQWDTWGEFTVANLTNFLQSAIDIVKKHDRDRPVFFNFISSHFSRNGVDWWYGRNLDLVGMSSGYENYSLELLRSVTGMNPWILELAAGPNEQQPFFSGDEIRVGTFNMLGYGVKGIIYYRWEPLMNRLEPWVHSIIEPGNYETERRKKIRDMITELHTVEDVLAEGMPPKADVAIYMPRSALATTLDTLPTRSSSMGYHSLLNDLGYEVEFITDHFMRDDPHRFVVVPAIVSLKRSETEAIDEYLENGGKVLFEPTLLGVERCATELEWLGLKPIRIDEPIYTNGSYIGWELRNPENEFVSWALHRRALLKETGEGIVDYRFFDDFPAIMRVKRDGNAIVPMFALGWSYLSGRLKGLRSILKEWVAEVEPGLQLDVEDFPEDYWPLVKAKVLKAEKRALLLITSKATSKVDVTVRVRGYRAVRTALRPFTAKKFRLEHE